MSKNVSKRNFAIIGTLVHSTDDKPLIILKDYCIGISRGKIVYLNTATTGINAELEKVGINACDIIRLREWQFVIPGFIDTHIHAPQYPNCGKGYEQGLLAWLQKYTFPVEAKFCNIVFAKEVYSKVVSRAVSNGTTTACYFATIDTDATLTLCDAIECKGQRALVGKVNMDQVSPDYYTEETKQSISETIRFIEEVKSREYELIKPCITPRFAVSCGMDLMKHLANLAKKYDLHIQTHLSETTDECCYVNELHPNHEHYTDIYDKAGLLTNKTILAHSIYLSEEEKDVIKRRKAGISHCPNSNLSIRSGFLDVRSIMKSKIPIGLGTDISAGYSCSILDAMRSAVASSNALSIQRENHYKHLDFREVFQMATLGGSKVLGMDDVIGNFVIGKSFDALIIDPKVHNSHFDIFDDDNMENIIQKFVFLGDDRNIISVFVNGTEVHSRSDQKTNCIV